MWFCFSFLVVSNHIVIFLNSFRWKQALLPKMIGMKSGGWSYQEDRALYDAVNKFKTAGRGGGVHWGYVSNEVIGRTPKHCVNRWNNHLKGKYIAQEEMLRNAEEKNSMCHSKKMSESNSERQNDVTSQECTYNHLGSNCPSYPDPSDGIVKCKSGPWCEEEVRSVLM